MGRPSLTLIREYDAEDGIHPSYTPVKDDQWEILFQMRIKNRGDVRADNWRVWLLLLMTRPVFYWIPELRAGKHTEKIRYPAGMKRYWMKERGSLIFASNLVRSILFPAATLSY